MTQMLARYLWMVVLAVLSALTIPWFLWGVPTVRFGLPIWIWWYIAWMGVTALVFWAFTEYAWGIWITGIEDE